jgi:hypothetical protein
MIKYNILQRTSLLLFYTLIIYAHDWHLRPWIEHVIAAEIFMVIITSQLFWKNPIKDSLIHAIDAATVRITMATTILYTIFYKLAITNVWYNTMYVTLLLGVVFSWYSSNYYYMTMGGFLTENHVFCHALLHYYGWLGSMFAFV